MEFSSKQKRVLKKMTASVLDWERSFNHPSYIESSFNQLNFVRVKKSVDVTTIDHFLGSKIIEMSTEDLYFSREEVKKEAKLWRKNNQTE